MSFLSELWEVSSGGKKPATNVRQVRHLFIVGPGDWLAGVMKQLLVIRRLSVK